ARRSVATLILPLACWSLFRILGHSMVISTATVRHGSAAILKRLGGFSIFEGDPVRSQFYDAYHKCAVEFVVYDSRVPAPKYEKQVQDIFEKLRADYPRDHWMPGIAIPA